MRNRLYLILIISIVFLLHGCQFDLSLVFEKGLKFEKSEICYSNEKRDIKITFEFPIGLENQDEFQKGWFVFEKPFKNVKEVKEAFIENYADKIDLSFEISTEDGKILNTINLNYNNTDHSFPMQDQLISESLPWKFTIPYTINDEIARAKQTLTGRLILKYQDPDDEKRLKAVASKPITIKYCCDKECTKNQILDAKECKCKDKVRTDDDFPPQGRLGSLRYFRGIRVKINDKEGTLHPTEFDQNSTDPIIYSQLMNNGKFDFENAKWVIPNFVNINSTQYKNVWSQFINTIDIAIKDAKAKGHYLYIIVQGSAHSGPFSNSAKNISGDELRIYNYRSIHYFSKLDFNQENIIANSTPYNFPDPVRNADLPNLRALFIKTLFQRNMDSPIGIIDGNVIPGRNASDRNAIIYLLHTTEPLPNDLNIFFK